MKFWAVALAASLAAGGALAKPHKPGKARISPAAAAERPADLNGSWLVEATTTVGDCPTLIPGNVTIADNRVADVAGAKLAAWGYVDETGTIVARFTAEGQRVARLHGTLKGSQGAGAWSSSTDLCGGAWRASRQTSAAAHPLSQLAADGAAGTRTP